MAIEEEQSIMISFKAPISIKTKLDQLAKNYDFTFKDIVISGCKLVIKKFEEYELKQKERSS